MIESWTLFAGRLPMLWTPSELIFGIDVRGVPRSVGSNSDGSLDPGGESPLELAHILLTREYRKPRKR